MIAAKKRQRKAVDALTEVKAGRACTGSREPTKRTNDLLPTATGQGNVRLLARDENSSPDLAEACGTELEGKCTNLSETTTITPVVELYSGKILSTSKKMKLQLFPVDEATREGLEKDGFHPYLELILSSRKKLSSVLKHLNTKWGRSTVAQGEPMLFPYNRVDHSASYRWTMKNNNISAGDVYASIGSPTLFRLRYGWYPDAQTNVHGKPFALNFSEDFGIKENGRITKLDNTSRKENSIKDNQVIKDGAFIQSSSMLWDDGISIGGLLSEASLQGKLIHSDGKSNGNNTGLQPPLLISESFDAFLSSQTNFKGPSAPLSSRSSILDAEDTCHAFAFKKFSTLGKDTVPLDGSGVGTSLQSTHDAGSKSFKFPNSLEAGTKSGQTQEYAHQESETELLLCSRVYNDESSLGMSGVKWTSLGPFDLGLSSSGKNSTKEELSFRNIINR